MTVLGVSLLVVGAIMVLVEAHVPDPGCSAGPGVILLGVGTVLAVSGLGGGLVLGLVTAVILVAATAGVLTLSLSKGMAVRRRRVRAGPEGMIGHVGTVRSWAEPAGKVLVDGALWHARRSACAPDEEVALHAGRPGRRRAAVGSDAVGAPRRGVGADRHGHAIIVVVIVLACSRWRPPARRSGCCASTSAASCSGSVA